MIGLNTLLIIKISIFYVIFLLTIYSIGNLFSKLFKLNIGILERLSLGFLCQIAIIQFLGWFFIAYKWKTSWFVGLVVCISLLISILNIVTSNKKTSCSQIYYIETTRCF